MLLGIFLNVLMGDRTEHSAGTKMESMLLRLGGPGPEGCTRGTDCNREPW